MGGGCLRAGMEVRLYSQIQIRPAMSSVTRGRLEAHRFTSVLETVQCDPLEIRLVFFCLFQ